MQKSPYEPYLEAVKLAKKKRRRKRDTRIPLVPAIAIASTAIVPCPSGRTLWEDAEAGDFEGLLYDLREKFAGVDNEGKFRLEWLIGTYGPIIAAGIVSKFAGRFVNPTLKRIPMVGRYIKL